MQIPTHILYGSQEDSSEEDSSARKMNPEARGRSRTPQTLLIPSFDGALDRYRCDSSPSPDPPTRTTRASARNQQQLQSSIAKRKRKRESNGNDREASPTKKPGRTFTPNATRTSTISEKQHPSEPTAKRKKTEPEEDSSPVKKAKRTSSGYAPPSKYAHLVNKLTDSLAPNLICVFVGVNPGIRTATTGHAYCHPSNLFWKLLHKSGCTPRLCRAEEDGDMPRLYDLGLTNIVSRPTKDASELSKAEMDAGVADLEAKTALQRPEAVAIVGKSIWESIWRVRHRTNIKKGQFRYGWQDDNERMGTVATEEDKWPGARVFVATTTSGLAAGMRPQEKEEVWKVLGEWVEQRRQQRTEENGQPTDGDTGNAYS